MGVDRAGSSGRSGRPTGMRRMVGRDAIRRADANICLMSRAFVSEDHAVEDMPDRPVSSHPNYVTRRGLILIETALDDARREYAQAQAAGDRSALGKTARDLRYWTARRASAELQQPAADRETVHFGSEVTIVRDDGRRQTFRIVGEDEADPNSGSISYVSPLARSLIGARIGDTVRAGAAEAEITAIA
jgi:transcription elongation GreA/GreB family factor